MGANSAINITPRMGSTIKLRTKKVDGIDIRSPGQRVDNGSDVHAPIILKNSPCYNGKMNNHKIISFAVAQFYGAHIRNDDSSGGTCFGQSIRHCFPHLQESEKDLQQGYEKKRNEITEIPATFAAELGLKIPSSHIIGLNNRTSDFQVYLETFFNKRPNNSHLFIFFRGVRSHTLSISYSDRSYTIFDPLCKQTRQLNNPAETALWLSGISNYLEPSHTLTNINVYELSQVQTCCLIC